MSGIGPPAARLRIGSMTPAQSELYGPITATSRSAAAYALAFAAQRRTSQVPLWAVEVSQEA